ncbi:DUF1654 domain-containing protein (plasmid) [Pseudomonas sp. HR96]|uniref:DUF1654 domain-containing protein n=1 Tax=Pseudomonas sp. HR96 TaxID=1027966 RepID=UPI002A766A69|nr:DUF1654 domain-containing protein [Pseudomonas sp. HR96]WPP02407.1 DUF1654 domain-containing protein [Pseudomonas sp. HR96]
MAKKPTSPPPLTSYALLGMRLQRAINSPGAQRSKAALLECLPGDLDEDWNEVLEQLGETDNVTVAHRDDGHLQIFWTVPDDD